MRSRCPAASATWLLIDASLGRLQEQSTGSSRARRRCARRRSRASGRGGDDRAALVARAVGNADAVGDDALVQLSAGADRHIIPQPCCGRARAESTRSQPRAREPRALVAGERRATSRGSRAACRCRGTTRRRRSRDAAGAARRSAPDRARSTDSAGTPSSSAANASRARDLDADEVERRRRLRACARVKPVTAPVVGDDDAAVLVGPRVRDQRHRHERARFAVARDRARQMSTSVSVSPLTIRKRRRRASTRSGSAWRGPPAEPSTGCSHE